MQCARGGKLHGILRAAIVATLVVWPSFASAAIIGPTDDWKPLAHGARDLGVSEEMVKRILAAGVELMCPGTVHVNDGVLNGWFLGDSTSSFYTIAHGVIDIGRIDRKVNFIEPLDQCTGKSYRDLATKGPNATAYPLAIPENRHEMELATFTPQSAPPNDDRAKLNLLHPVAGARALPLPDMGAGNLAVGQEVILVSMTPPLMRVPEIQACHIKSIKLRSMRPGLMFTDCDNRPGNSAGLYFMRDPARPGMLLPIALHEGCHEKRGDYQAWDQDDNTAVGIMLQSNFFALQARS